MSNLHDRVARVLGWSSSDVQSLSMQSLRDLVRPVDPDLTRELDLVIQSGAYIRGEPASARDDSDVTAEVLRDSSYGPGELVQLVAKAKPAKNVEATPTLAAALSRFRTQNDRTMGYISKPLAYSRAMPRGKRDHADLIRLIKGGYVHVRKMMESPPDGSTARREAPYGLGYYELHLDGE